MQWRVNYSDHSGDVDKNQTKVYYCAHCGIYCLLLNADVLDLPRRNMEHNIAYVDDPVRKDRVYKTQLHETVDCVYVQRDASSGVAEEQFRFKCRRCELLIGYSHKPNSTRPAFLLCDAVTADSSTVLKKINEHMHAMQGRS
jgi:hypothetical protein